MRTWQDAYEACPRFDESDMYRTAEVDAIYARKIELMERLLAAVGPKDRGLVEDYADVMYEEAEAECRYYFQMGFEAARR
ncbi:hypothetical protein [Beduinella massiliensis]|uniref:hypothetical protein n=1 Tax=Beduinella massiliensis TaxID=1852363 RepID=UPI000C816FF0